MDNLAPLITHRLRSGRYHKNPNGLGLTILAANDSEWRQIEVALCLASVSFHTLRIDSWFNEKNPDQLKLRHDT